MNSIVDDRTLTDLLKSFAIFTVLINHYVNIFISRSYTGLAYGFIALFFALSGYGLFFSFERQDKATISSTLAFYLKRCLRIYPLYWVSLVITAYTINNWEILSTFLMPDARTNIVYWFLNALLQCYLVAPLLFYLVKKLNPFAYVILNTVVIIIINLSLLYSLPSDIIYIKYHSVRMGHLYLFALGMVIPRLTEINGTLAKRKSIVLISFLLFLFFVYATRKTDTFFTNSGVFLSPLFFLSTLFFCFSILANRFDISNTFYIKPILSIGVYSFSMYLFHLDYFRIVSLIPFVGDSMISRALYIVAFFPLFFLICVLLEKTINLAMEPLRSGIVNQFEK